MSRFTTNANGYIGKSEKFTSIEVEEIASVSGGTLDLLINGGPAAVVIQSNEAAADAVRINAQNTAGGIDVDAGTGGIAANTSGSLDLTSSEGAADAVLVTASGSTGGVTFATGSGGIVFPHATVTQGTNITTTVVANAVSGVITTVALTSATGTDIGPFTVTNNRCGANSVVLVSIGPYGGAGTPVVIVDAIAAGSFDLRLSNAGGASLNAAVAICFVVI